MNSLTFLERDELKQQLCEVVATEADVENVLDGSMTALDCTRQELEKSLNELRDVREQIEKILS